MTKKLKPNWRIVRFGDVVHNVNTVERKPRENGIERFVGLEHLDSESLHIKRWGLVADGTTFTRKFTRGQVLFGKRRAYQRKVAVAEFDGICSSDILVFEPANDELLPELLPFIVQSDGFFERALGTSAGSLSPRTKWKDLAEYEFALPPLDEQRRIAELLWAADETVERLQELFAHAQLLKDANVRTLFTNGIGHNKCKRTAFGIIPAEWDVITLGEVADPRKDYSFTGGPFGSDLKASTYTSSGVRIIQLQNIGDGQFLDDYKIYTSAQKADELRNCNIFPGEIIISKMAEPLARACFVPNQAERYLMASDGVRLSVDKTRFDSRFVLYEINSPYFRNNAIAKAAGSTRLRIGLGALRDLPFVVPPLDEQKRIADILLACDNSITLISNHQEKTKIVKSNLIEHLLAR